MPLCSSCGQSYDNKLDRCPNCGTPNKSKDNSNQFTKEDLYNMAFNTEDSTNSVSADDIKNNQLITFLSYLWILALIPYFCAKDSAFARYHAVRGLNLFIIQFAVGVVLGIICKILPDAIEWIVSIPVNLVSLAFSVIGIVNVFKGRCRELPFIGGFKIVK